MSEIIIPKEKHIKAYINGTKINHLVSFEKDSENYYYPIKELLSGETDSVKNSETHILKLTLPLMEEIPDNCVIRISTPFCEDIYSDCRIIRVQEKAVAGGEFSREYTMRAVGLQSRKISG